MVGYTLYTFCQSYTRRNEKSAIWLLSGFWRRPGQITCFPSRLVSFLLLDFCYPFSFSNCSTFAPLTSELIFGWLLAAISGLWMTRCDCIICCSRVQKVLAFVNNSLTGNLPFIWLHFTKEIYWVAAWIALDSHAIKKFICRNYLTVIK